MFSRIWAASPAGDTKSVDRQLIGWLFEAKFHFSCSRQCVPIKCPLMELPREDGLHCHSSHAMAVGLEPLMALCRPQFELKGNARLIFL